MMPITTTPSLHTIETRSAAGYKNIMIWPPGVQDDCDDADGMNILLDDYAEHVRILACRVVIGWRSTQLNHTEKQGLYHRSNLTGVSSITDYQEIYAFRRNTVSVDVFHWSSVTQNG